MKRSKSMYGNGVGALRPDYGAKRARIWARKCAHCAEMSERIERFKKVIADKDAHIASQSAFIEKVRRLLREEAIGLTVSPLGRAAKRGNL